MKSIRCSFLLIVPAVVMLFSAIPVQAEHRLINLGTLGGDLSVAWAINDRGEIVGYSTSSNGEQHAFCYRDGFMRSLDDKPSAAVAINDAGQITGTYLTRNQNTLTNWIPSFTQQPVVFQADAQVNLLQGNNTGYASGINNQGEIVGSIDPGHAFVFRNGLVTELPILSSADGPSAATAINNHGDIVGFSGISPQHPFLYSCGLMYDLGTLGGSIAGALAINNRGEIAGFSTTTSNAEMHAFLYRQGRMIDLGGLQGVQQGTNQVANFHPKMISYGSAINNWGQIVGNASTTNGANHAFLYSDGTMTDLNSLVKLAHVNGSPGFLTLIGAVGINNWGQIVGIGSFWDGTLRNPPGISIGYGPLAGLYPFTEHSAAIQQSG